MHAVVNAKIENESMRITPLDFCLRVFVNEKPLNLEKPTSSVLSVLLFIHGYNKNVTSLLSLKLSLTFVMKLSTQKIWIWKY